MTEKELEAFYRRYLSTEDDAEPEKDLRLRETDPTGVDAWMGEDAEDEADEK